MAHTSLHLLSAFVCGQCFQLVHLLEEKVLEKLVFVAHFEELGHSALVIIKNGFELGDPLAALLADPVVNFFVRAVEANSVVCSATLKYFCRPSKPLQRVGFILGRPIKEW